MRRWIVLIDHSLRAPVVVGPFNTLGSANGKAQQIRRRLQREGIERTVTVIAVRPGATPMDELVELVEAAP